MLHVNGRSTYLLHALNLRAAAFTTSVMPPFYQQRSLSSRRSKMMLSLFLIGSRKKEMLPLSICLPFWKRYQRRTVRPLRSWLIIKDDWLHKSKLFDNSNNQCWFWYGGRIRLRYNEGSIVASVKVRHPEKVSLTYIYKRAERCAHARDQGTVSAVCGALAMENGRW